MMPAGRLTSRIATAAALAALGLAPVVASLSPASASTHPALTRAQAKNQARPQVPGGTQLWEAMFDGGAGRIAVADSVAASPDGSTVYVSGVTAAAGTLETKPNRQLVTVAYNAATGAVVWTTVYKSTHHHPGGPTFVAVSPDGSQVFVEAATPFPGQVRFAEYVTLAYNAATGAQEWETTSPAEYAAAKQGLAVSPDGSRLYITGLTGQIAYHTLALSTATGTEIWSSDYAFRRNSDQTASFIAVSPDGSEVFVVGQAGVVAYDAATGNQLWAVPYKLGAERRFQSLAVSPDSSTLYVTGKGAEFRLHGYETIAYNARTGTRLWRQHARGQLLTEASSVAVNPDGSAVYVTGDLHSKTAATIAYNAATGAREWTRMYAGLDDAGAYARQVEVSPDGSTVYVLATTTVAGQYAYLVFAYDAATGARLWASRFAGPSGEPDTPLDMAVSETGVFVTGNSQIPPSGQDQYEMATVAFQP
jgi:outer membrane protein assembly factor BamB